MQAVKRESVDLSGYPNLVVIYLGIQVSGHRGLAAMLGIGRGISDVARHKPDGLLLHESLIYGINHLGMRQYWRDLDSLERFTRSEPHRSWWRRFASRNQGAGIWHETYRIGGGMEAIYSGMTTPVGFARFAPAQAPDGARQSTRGRLAPSGELVLPQAVDRG